MREVRDHGTAGMSPFVGFKSMFVHRVSAVGIVNKLRVYFICRRLLANRTMHCSIVTANSRILVGFPYKYKMILYLLYTGN